MPVILSIKAVNTLAARFVLLAVLSRASWSLDRDESRIFHETLRRRSVGGYFRDGRTETNG